MGFEIAEGFDVAIVALQEIKAAMTDSATPGKITKEEWVQIAAAIGQKAFQEALD